MSNSIAKIKLDGGIWRIKWHPYQSVYYLFIYLYMIEFAINCRNERRRLYIEL